MAKSVKLAFFIFGVLLLGPAVYAQQRPGTIIQQIKIRGNRRISEENCRFYIQSREGEPYDESLLDIRLALPL